MSVNRSWSYVRPLPGPFPPRRQGYLRAPVLGRSIVLAARVTKYRKIYDLVTNFMLSCLVLVFGPGFI